MNKFKGIIENIVGSLAATGIIYFISILISHPVTLPELYIYVGSKAIVGPPYTFLLIVAILIYFTLSAIMSGRIVWNRKLGQVCKQFRYYSQIWHFASNGIARYNFICKDEVPCIKICLQNFVFDFSEKEGFTTSADCGIVFVKHRNLLGQSFLISDKKIMRFEIMGEKGGEKIGVSIKNINGHEQKHPLTRFLDVELDKNTWKVVEIDLNEYAHVTRSANDKAYLQNFSIFTNSNLLRNKEIVVYIRNIRFV